MQEITAAERSPLAWDKEPDRAAAMAFAEEYKRFLDAAKTEREAAKQVLALAERAGFRDLRSIPSVPGALKPGDRVYFSWMDKAAVLFTIGSEPLEEGLRIVGAHLDAPRLDLKLHPLYEEKQLTLLKTHYYGGIKKYQWGTTPLSLHGVAVKKDGTRVTLSVGEAEEDPVFYISDLPIHLAAKQMEKKLSDGLEGEDLNVICGSVPGETGPERVKSALLALLKERYGLEEEDFVSAEIEVVPAGHARDVGFDRGLIASYSHDDRICVYTTLQALLGAKAPGKTAVGLFVDKEEIGSVGATGMESRLFENAVAEVMARTCGYDDLGLRRLLARSRMLSADVSVALDPSFSDCFEERNAIFLGRGLCVEKYVGHRGKKESNDANPEYLAWLRRVFDEGNVAWQCGEQGRIDLGGGGTISYRMAIYGMEVVDCGVPLLSMHAPYELASKADVYAAYRGYRAFYEAR